MKLAVAHIHYSNEESYQVEAEMLDKRFMLANEILYEVSTSRHDIDLLVFPAGYLVSESHDKCIPLAKKFADNLSPRNYTIAFGIDHKTNNSNSKKTSKDFAHGFVIGSEGQQFVWGITQLGFGSDDSVLSNTITRDRFFDVGEFRVGLLICGEMTTKVEDIRGTPRISEFLAKETDLLIDLTHADRKIQPPNISWYPAMKAAGRPCVLAEHIWDDYLGNGHYCHDAETGPEYSHMLETLESKMTTEYSLVFYSTEPL